MDILRTSTFSRSRSHFETRKKNQGQNQGTCASARVGWCESLPRLVAEAPQIPRIAEWRTLAAVGLRAR